MTAGDYVLYNNSGTAEFRKVTATELAANKAYQQQWWGGTFIVSGQGFILRKVTVASK